MKMLLKFMAIGLLLAIVSVTGLATRVEAQKKDDSNAQETDDPVKVDMYTKFIQTYKTDLPAAHHAGKDYLAKYGRDHDRYSTFIQQWVDSYDREERMKTLLRLVTERNFVEAFPIGKVVMAEEPDQLDSLIALSAAGNMAASARNTNFDKEAIAYSRRAIQLIEAGKAPDNWAPYKGKDDTLAHLYLTLGWLQLKPAPNEAIDLLIKSVQFESEIKKVPVNYYRLAQAYQEGPYAKLSVSFQAKFGDKPETPESKQALEKLNQVIDVMIDAYGRSVALAGTDPQYAQLKTAWLTTLTSFYKFRHQDSDAGLTEYIAGVLSKPLPARP